MAGGDKAGSVTEKQQQVVPFHQRNRFNPSDHCVSLMLARSAQCGDHVNVEA